MAALAAGLGLAAAGSPAALAVAAAGAAVGLAARPRVAAACCVLLLAGGVVGGARLRAIDAAGHRLAPYSRFEQRAVLLERPRPVGDRTHATVEVVDGPGRGARLLAVADGSWPSAAKPGDELRVSGVLKPPPGAADEGAFDWGAHLRRRGIAHEVHVTGAERTGETRRGLAGALDSARRRAEEGVATGLRPDRQALLRGMVLGQDEAIDQLTKDDWRDSGLAHLLAVSGQNVMLLCALALPLLARAGAPPRARVAGLLALIALYVPVAGAGPSLQRAAVMGAAGLVALGASRPRSGVYALLLAAVVTLAANPRIAADAGWQLSFAAVAGMLGARPFAPRGALLGALWLTAVAALATAPLLALHFQAVSLVAIPANMLALPAVAPVMWIGMIEAAVGQLAVLGGPGREISRVVSELLAAFADPLLGWLQTVAARAAETPHAVASVRVPGGALGIVSGYAAIVLAAWAATRGARRAAPHAEAARLRLRWLPRRLLAAVLLVALAGALATGARVLRPPAPNGLAVAFLDVGQGDATLVQHGETAVLFDGGPAGARVARLLRRSGVRRLDVVVATHASADHHGGLAEVVRRFPVDLLLDGGDGTADPSFRELLALARARGVRVLRATAGQELQVGMLEVRVLSPPRRPPGPAPADPNPRAVVAVVTSGRFDLLLSADAESPTLAGLDLPDVEAIKVPHHGSADPGLPAVLARARPEVAVIEVGDNSYGHPHPDTLAALDARVPRVRRTDRHGTVTLSVADGRMLLE